MYSNLEKWCNDVGYIGKNMMIGIVDEGKDILKKAVFGDKKEIKNDNKENTKNKYFCNIPAGLKKGNFPFAKAGWNTLHFNKHRHKLIKGATECGKTTWGERFAIESNSGIAYLDNADGLAINRILQSLPNDRLNKTVLLDYSNTDYIPPAGHIEHTKDIFKQYLVTEQWIEFFKSHFGISELYRTENLITYACSAVFAVEGTTILDVIKIVKDEEFRGQLLKELDRKFHKDIIDWWLDFEEKTKSKQDQITGAFLIRAGLLQKDYLLKFALGQKPKRKLDYRKWMDQGYTVLIKVPESLGKKRVNIIMSLHILGFWQAALSRDNIKESERKPFYIIADEPQSWLNNNEKIFDAIYSKARKYKMYMCSLFQSYKQLPNNIKQILLDNEPDIIDFSPDSEDIKLNKYHFVCTMFNKKPFIAKSLGPAHKLRKDISPFIYLQKKKNNKYFEEIQNELDRRDFYWQIQRELPRSSIKQKSGHESQKKIGKSLNSSIVKGW
ncbi:MAG: hypothetical protein ACOCRK_06535 [bacterium]